jgi:hypothetical protein
MCILDSLLSSIRPRDMTEKFNSQISLEERVEIFQTYYGNYGDASYTFLELLTRCGDYISMIVGKHQADLGMALIVDGITGNIEDPSTWKKTLELEATYAFEKFPLGMLLFELHAYGHYGITISTVDDIRFPLPGAATEEEKAKRIEHLIDVAEEFLAMSPLEQWSIKNSEFLGFLQLAKNRWALDHGEPVEPKALAVFGGIAESSVRNMMSGANRTFSNLNGCVPANEALAWLGKRASFWNSIWRDDSTPMGNERQGITLGEPVFIPVARDGSVFHPGLKRSGAYTIGKKREEAKYEDFDEALKALHAMPIPYWRRPNDKGIPGIVKGLRWERMDRDQLAEISAKPNFRLPTIGGN